MSCQMTTRCPLSVTTEKAGVCQAPVPGDPRTLGRCSGHRGTKSDVHPTDGETDSEREGRLPKPLSKQGSQCGQEGEYKSVLLGDQGEAKTIRHLPCLSSAPTLKVSSLSPPPPASPYTHSLFYGGSNQSSERLHHLLQAT